MNTEFGFQDGEGYDDQEPTKKCPAKFERQGEAQII